MQPFTRNYIDNSDESGFKFTFNCDICGDGYKTSFIESKSRKKAGFLRGLGTAASIGTSLLGSSVGYGVERGANASLKNSVECLQSGTRNTKQLSKKLKMKQKVISRDAQNAESMFAKWTGMNRKDSAYKMPLVRALKWRLPRLEKW